ncbi:MAG: winged helix-turn-helix domain-containing protein [Acidobacteriota bacterium]
MSQFPSHVTYRFGDFELNTAAYELRNKGQPVRLGRQPMDVLLLLLTAERALVSREDMGRQLWGDDVFVDRDAGINTAILRIRQALGDSSASSLTIETVPGKGYRFVAPVEVVPVSNGLAAPDLVPGPQPGPDARRDNLSAELTSFVGRQKELSDLSRLLSASRLLTLTGAGGVGKTRLALRLASRLVDDFPHGVWLIDLGSLTAPALLAQTIATVVGVRESPLRSVRAALLDNLRDRELLLVLDTCEHLIDAVAELVDVLLRQAPALRIVATSRETLGVPGETVYRVPSLPLPEILASVPAGAPAHSDATELFVERALAIDPAFAADAVGARTIARICRRLDGIPLAIELAAARVSVLSLEEIEVRLDNRFHLLTGGARTAVARQRRLEATIDWSYQLLSPAEQLLLNRLSVFPASWTLDAAATVCAGDGILPQDILDLLSRLVSKSLIALECGLGRRAPISNPRNSTPLRMGAADSVRRCRSPAQPPYGLLLRRVQGRAANPSRAGSSALSSAAGQGAGTHPGGPRLGAGLTVPR